MESPPNGIINFQKKFPKNTLKILCNLLKPHQNNVAMMVFQVKVHLLQIGHYQRQEFGPQAKRKIATQLTTISQASVNMRAISKKC